MSEPPREPSPSGIEERPRLLSVEIGDGPGLGGTVHLDVDPQRTLLIGKTGAGKSLICEGLYWAAHQAVFCGRLQWAGPGSFRCEVALPGGDRVAYEYTAGRQEVDEEPDGVSSERPSRGRLTSWSERFQRLGDGSELWRIENAGLTTPGREKMPFEPASGLLELFAKFCPIELPKEAELLQDLLVGVGIVSAGTPRWEIAKRREIRVRSTRGGTARFWQYLRGSDRAQDLATTMLSNWEHRRAYSDEVIELLRRLQLVQDVTFRVYPDPKPGPDGKREDYACVLFDGTNIGLLSAGTLRVTEIVIELLHPGASCVLIEAPDTAVDPGLLGRLLALIESYSFDRQIILSTHAPQIVDRFHPAQVRLVERERGTTSIRSLSPEDRARITQYLDDEGTFSDFLFGRATE
jgi:hypothetical protein